MSEHRDPHLDLDALADVLAEGVEPAHLTSCPDCRARLAELEAALPDVAAALSAVPAPEVPTGLEERLVAALAGEAAPAPTNVLPLTHRRTRWLPALGAVAAAAVLVTGAVVLTGGGTPSTSSDTAAAPGYRVNNTGSDYTAARLAGALPGLLSGSAPEAATADKAPTQGRGAATPTQEAGGTFDTLAAPDPLAELRTTAGLARCLASLTDPDDAGVPLALDYASYGGKPALVVVLPSSRPDKVDVLVVPPGCAQADGQLYYFTRLPKP